MYVIYDDLEEANVRRNQITKAAQKANFLDTDSEYDEVIEINGKVALPVVITESIYYNYEVIKGLDFSIFFTPQEIASSVSSLD